MNGDRHAGPLRAEVEGRCAWRSRFGGVDLACGDRVIPGALLCADHYIADVQSRPDPDVRPLRAQRAPAAERTKVV